MSIVLEYHFVFDFPILKIGGETAIFTYNPTPLQLSTVR